ncbi:short-chain fatty acyl-CoA regulator family protein [Gordonia sp. HY002]|uniref:short-chain fatty acyl-CoA regulator family protein n=1 Tax=Gordonia zhenghanii TaxID=2911516 RepID=UPI001EF0DE93|nr:short-chain fatty acyl-CoA regulator family protein [Gordonia zhenghanii]MCF8570547.1 short-chain fatty acyl-CoA regulator family protein [Gordonia zhenghanii]MCF8607673.1 short-chain fatty acyl-CoA regulator family protein [Gordonia zhenghanii]
MAKTYVGARLRRLRADLGISQAALARRVDLSTTYVNQLENDHRPITVSVLLNLTSAFDLPADFFADSGDARLSADVADALLSHGESADRAEITELVSRMPSVGRTLVNLNRRLTAATTALEDQRSADTAPPDVPMTPFEQVRDYFYDRRNHITELDTAAEHLFIDAGFTVGGLDLQLAQHLDDVYGIRVTIGSSTDPSTAKRRFDPESATVTLARRLTAGQRAFQLATQLALLSHAEQIDALIAASTVAETSRAVLRVGLANYFAGALVLPYGLFASTARELRYDVGLLARRFEVGFETVCHRLSTLQRPGDRGIPFIFVRVDRAGNISKRQSATAFHFSRVGGNCPLWVVHDAFSMPGRIHTQVSEMPDGRKYFWLARTTDIAAGSHLSTTGEFAIGLGCDLAHADELVYTTGINLSDPRTVVPIGAGCKVCDRPACSQRAFPMLGHGIAIDELVSDSVPYRPA